MCGPNFETLFPGLGAFGRDKQIAWMMWHAAPDRKLPEISRVREGVPEDLALGVQKLATKDQSDRYASADEALSDLQIDLRIDSALGWVVRDAQRIEGRVGDTVGLLALGQQATGVTTIGLAWPLNDAVLEPGTGLGLSNRMTEEVAEIRMSSGVLLVLKDGPDRPDHE